MILDKTYLIEGPNINEVLKKFINHTILEEYQNIAYESIEKINDNIYLFSPLENPINKNKILLTPLGDNNYKVESFSYIRM